MRGRGTATDRSGGFEYAPSRGETWEATICKYLQAWQARPVALCGAISESENVGLSTRYFNKMRVDRKLNIGGVMAHRLLLICASAYGHYWTGCGQVGGCGRSSSFSQRRQAGACHKPYQIEPDGVRRGDSRLGIPGLGCVPPVRMRTSEHCVMGASRKSL